jgi:hypothetical protein
MLKSMCGGGRIAVPPRYLALAGVPKNRAAIGVTVRGVRCNAMRCGLKGRTAASETAAAAGPIQFRTALLSFISVAILYNSQ